jgi:hypothetical protein
MTEKEFPKKYNAEVCKIKHKLVDEKINRIKDSVVDTKEDLNKETEEIKILVKEIKNEVKRGGKNSQNRIKFLQEQIHTKLDEIDRAFRGNGKIGVFEQLRDIKKDFKMFQKDFKDNTEDINKTIKRNFRITLILVALIIGGKVFGLSLKTIKDYFFGTNKNITQVEKNVGQTKPNVEYIVMSDPNE